MGKIGYLVIDGIDNTTEFFEEGKLPTYLEYSPEYSIKRIVYFGVEEDYYGK